ncbi:hypothetical protein [Nocardia sp. NPDC058497]|uniref:hypothetical protein n=1 Tax=Nocardia sp. NPDC058497 TaxID=3346529 RepID=UPI003669C26B
MNHAEHDESIGSMLASIAAALREVSDKLDIVAARVQQEVPPFPADEDLPDQTRIRRLESWAFHASQDISRLSSRLDALDGGESEQAPPRAGRSRREVREAAEAAERAAADLDEGAPEGGAAESARAVDAGRPPLERRHSRTDHLGDPTWPITVAPVPRSSAAFESAGEVAGVAALLGSEGAPGSPVTDSMVTGVQPVDRAQRLNGARSADTAVNGARATDRPTRNGAAPNGAQVPNGAAPLRNTQAVNDAGTVNGVTAIDGAELLEARPWNEPSAQVCDAASPPVRNAVPAQDGGTQSAVAGGADPAESGHTRNGQPIGHGSSPFGASSSSVTHVPASSTAGVPASTGVPAAIGTMQADADPLAAAHHGSLSAAESGFVGAARQRAAADGTAPGSTGIGVESAADSDTSTPADHGLQRLGTGVRLSSDGAGSAPVSTAAGGTSNSMSGNGIGVAPSDPAADGRGSDDAEITVPGSVAAQSGAARGRQGAARSDDSVIQALEWQVTQRLSSNGSGRDGWTAGAGRDADSGERAGSISALGRDGTSSGTQSDDSATLGSSSLPGSAEVGDVVRGGDVSLSGITADQANTAAMNAIPEGRADVGHRVGVERARPVGKPAEGTAAPVEDARVRPASPDALSGTGIDATGRETTRAVSDPRSAGLTAGDRTEPVTNGYPVNGFGAPVTATPTPTSGSTANGIHWTFTDEDATLPAPSRNGHARNGFTGGDAPHRTESIFDDFTPRERLTTTPSGDGAPTPAGPPARLSAPKSHAETGTGGSGAPSPGSDPALPHGNSPDLGTPAGVNASTNGRGPALDPAPTHGTRTDLDGPADVVLSSNHGGFDATANVRRPADLDPAGSPNTPADFGTSPNRGTSTNGHGPGELTHSAPTDFGTPPNLGPSTNGRGELTHSARTDFGGSTSPHGSANGRGPGSFDPTVNHGVPSDFPASAGDGAPVTSPLDRVVADPAPPTATDAAGITVTGTFRAFDIERAHVDKLQAMLDELKRSAGLPPGRRDVFGPPTTEAG